MRTTRIISLTNFCVASSALAFQVFVLYPWHHQLQHDFEELKQEHLRVLRTMSASARPIAARAAQAAAVPQAAAAASPAAAPAAEP